MMGRQTGDQGQLFYLFNLERRIPAGHLLRRINPVVTRILVELREKLTPFYSAIGIEPKRPSALSLDDSPPIPLMERASCSPGSWTRTSPRIFR